MPTDSDFQTVTADALQRLDDIFTIATDFKTTALADMDALVLAAQTHVALLNAETFDPTYPEGISLTYSSPSEPVEPDYSGSGPAAPTLASLNNVTAFNYSNTSYSELIQTEMQAKFASVLGDNLVVPTAIWDAIYTRALAAVTRQKTAAQRVSQNRAAAEGWELPSIVTTTQLAEANEEAARQTIALVVEQAIGEARERHSDLWQALEKGTPFEEIWINEHNTEEARKLQAARTTVEMAIEVNNNLLRSNDQLLREYAIKWETPLKYIAEETRRFQARVANGNFLVNSQQVRSLYQRIIVDKGLATERGATDLAVARTELAKVLVDSQAQVASLMSAMAQGALAASDVSVGTGTSYGYQENLTL